MATATATTTVTRHTRPKQATCRHKSPPAKRVLVTDHFDKQWAALVTVDPTANGGRPLLCNIAGASTIKRQAARINRENAGSASRARAFVRPIEVHLQRGVSLETAIANRATTADDPYRVLVTDSLRPFAACVVACPDDDCTHDFCEPLVGDIGDPTEMARQVERHNNDPSDTEAGIRAFICPVDVWLKR